MRRGSWFLRSLVCVAGGAVAIAASDVPTDVQQPGTQPGEVGSLESPDKCDNCHGGYNRAVEPAFNWRGSMMANAGRDPLFWATLAVAEQDFDGAGDLCLRCHSTAGWMAGRSTPTDGSGLAAGDADGVDCDTCHKMTNPDGSEWKGVMNEPFVANDGGSPPTAYLGSGMLSLWGGAEKLGPYADPVARHQFQQSQFHRSVDFCGSCHDVSNPVVGDLAPGNGAPEALDDGTYSGTPGAAVSGKAAFNNLPARYGVVERTFSEFKSGALSRTLVSSYGSSAFPADLRRGAVKAAFDAAGGDYADGTSRTFSCQTCHMRAITGPGCNKSGAPLRTDLPLHDMTGGNTWAPAAILDQDARQTLRLGGPLASVQKEAIAAGASRARQQLAWAAALDVSGNTVRVTNLTGHKLITGYPEGRRMWLNTKWFDASGAIVREDGAYGELAVSVAGFPALTKVRTLLDPADPNTKVWAAHYGMTQAWAARLVDEFGYDRNRPLAFDREDGAVTLTLGGVADLPAGAAEETFHFVLNDRVLADDRIPPYGFSYDEAKARHALPVPASQYGDPGPGGTYRHWDELPLEPPDGAAYAELRLLYQTTSWEYVQFLHLANAGTSAFLGAEGRNLVTTWAATGMAEPEVIATASWGTPPTPPCAAPAAPTGLTAAAGKKSVTLKWPALAVAPTGGWRVHYVQAGKLAFRAAVAPATLTYKDTGLSSRVPYSYVITAWNDCNGNGTFDAGIDRESGPSNTATATAQ